MNHKNRRVTIGRSPNNARAHVASTERTLVPRHSVILGHTFRTQILAKIMLTEPLCVTQYRKAVYNDQKTSDFLIDFRFFLSGLGGDDPSCGGEASCVEFLFFLSGVAPSCGGCEYSLSFLLLFPFFSGFSSSDFLSA